MDNATDYSEAAVEARRRYVIDCWHGQAMRPTWAKDDRIDWVLFERQMSAKPSSDRVMNFVETDPHFTF